MSTCVSSNKLHMHIFYFWYGGLFPSSKNLVGCYIGVSGWNDTSFILIVVNDHVVALDCTSVSTILENAEKEHVHHGSPYIM